MRIFRIGTIGPGHGLINLIKSLKYLPVNYNLTLCGIVLNKNFYYDLKNIIRSSNIERRIKIYPSASKKQWVKKMIDSDLGVAFYEPVNTSHKFMTGASQKIIHILQRDYLFFYQMKNNLNYFQKNINVV